MMQGGGQIPQEIQQAISQIPPEVLYYLLIMFLNTKPEELKQLLSQLQQQIEGGGQQSPQQQPGQEPVPEDANSGQSNLYA